MELITCKHAYYVKLGRHGSWEESSIKRGIIRIGWKHQSLSDINTGNWSRIEKQLRQENTDRGTATRDCNALRLFCESTPDDIWITFHANHLWWCRLTKDYRIRKDGISKYRKTQGWHKNNIFNEPLLTTQIPGRISKIQGFRGTICKVKEVDELVRLINRQNSLEYTVISHSKEALCQHVESGLRRLHWKDFETLVDLLYRASGWRRVSVLGEAMKYSDIELEDPITGDMYQVQVKSRASVREFREYSDVFGGGKYRKLFFVVHSPDKKLAEMQLSTESPIQLVLPKQLAEMVVGLGLLSWLMNKVR
jgi:hypothetical protein